MRHFKPFKFHSRTAGIRAKIFGAILCTLMLLAPGFSFGEDEDVSRMSFIRLMAQNQSQSKLIPQNATSLSDEELYAQVAQNLKSNGFNVLEGKNPEKALNQQEFVRLTYAFSDQPSGKSLFEQKKYLKDAEILSTADVGLTTGLEGRAVQYRGEEDAFAPSEIAAPVFMQDRVETDLNSMVTFTFDDGSSLSMGEDAVVNITEHIYDPERDFRKTIVNVALGAVRFKVTKGKAEGSMFQVITPVATAGVRGTEFVTIVGPQGQTKFVGLEGKVETFPRFPDGREGKHEFVVAGTMHEVASDHASSGLQRADAATLDKVFKATNPKKKINGNPKVTMAKAMLAVQGDLKLGKALGKNKGDKEGQGKNKGNKQANNNKGKGGKDNKGGKGKGPEKGNVKKAGKDSAKGAAKDSAKSAAKGAAKNAAKTAAKGAAKESAKLASKKAAKEAAIITAKNSIKESAKQTIKASANINGGNPNPVDSSVAFLPPGQGGTPYGLGGPLPPGLGGGGPPGLGGGGPPGGGPPGGGPPGGGPPGGGPPGGGPPGGGP